ncbi:MAG: hypothetical protein ACKV0T_06720 [Planctomycetales bacterium]
MLTSLILPIVLATVALFFASFLTWMVLPLHKADWRKLPKEDELHEAMRRIGIPPGNYMFPMHDSPEQMKSPEFQAKWEAGPAGVITVFRGMNMGRNLGLTLLYFLGVNFCLAYLATLALPSGAEFMRVFRFVATAGWLAFFSAIVPHAIWFRCRIVGHVVESIGYALIAGAIFAALWPAA